MGRGFVTCRHGVLPLPAPATVTCLRGIPTYDAGIEAELVTPTGAAIVAGAATGFSRWPSFAPERTGWGKGTRELPDRPNVLRDPSLDNPTASRWFDTSAFTMPARGTFGNAGRNIVDGPGFQSINASISRFPQKL